MAETRGLVSYGPGALLAGALAAGTSLACLLAACAAPGPRALPTPAAADSAAAGSPAHGHWRSLVPAPFGSRVAQVPFPMNEVLLFHRGPGDAPARADAEDQECFSNAGSPLEFRGAHVEDYVVCFFQERLFRVEAALRLPADAPADSAQRWCTDWREGTQPLPVAKAASTNSAVCAGVQGGTAFSASVSADDQPGQVITVAVYDMAARAAFDALVQRAGAATPSRPVSDSGQ